jgi:hypothetical protein
MNDEELNEAVQTVDDMLRSRKGTMRITDCLAISAILKELKKLRRDNQRAKSEGARVERAECIKIAKGFKDSSGYRIPQRIAEAIRDRGNQADEKVGE